MFPLLEKLHLAPTVWGLGLGQTFLTGDFGKNGEDSITVDLYYKYKASYSFDLIVNAITQSMSTTIKAQA